MSKKLSKALEKINKPEDDWTRLAGLQMDQDAVRRKVALKLYEKRVEQVYSTMARGPNGLAAVMADAFTITVATGPDDDKVPTEQFNKIVEDCTALDEKAQKLSSQKTTALFVTVSGQNHTVDDLDACAKKFRKPLKGAKWTMYTLEQCGGVDDKPLGHRPHLHMLIVLDKSVQQGEPARMERTVKGAFHRLSEGSHTLQVKRIGTEDTIMSKIRYLKGEKDDKRKHAMSKQDEVWRDKNNIEPWYGTVDENDFEDPLGSKS